MHLVMDFETRSVADLKKCGIYRYVEHPSTRILCCAWVIVDDVHMDHTFTTNADVFFDMDHLPINLGAALEDDTVEIHAHNAAVERLVIEHIAGPRHGWPVPRRSRWRCSAARVGKLAVPRSLEKAALALRVPVQKDMEGNKVMRRLMKPIKRDPVLGWIYDDDPAKLERLGVYCQADVDAEVAVERVTFPLTPMEQNRYLLVERMNDRGVHVDTDLVRDLLMRAMENTAELDRELAEITDGQVPTVTAIQKLKDWIYAETGISLTTLRKEDMENLDADQFKDYPRVSRAIELRQLGGKSSVAKLRTFLDRTSMDGQLRGAFICNATSTGRLISTGVQLHNLPRECLKDYDARIADLDTLTVKDISTAIRGVIIPDTPDHVFIDADFNAVEARGVGWLAGASKLVKLFRDGGDPYCAIACVIYGRLIIKDRDDDERFVGKQTILGCGYGMGPPKFEAQCIKFGKPVGSLIAEKAVGSYRSDYSEIPALWKGLEKAAIAAVNRPGKVTDYNGIEFKLSSGFLQMRLPSGRRLYYMAPTIRDKPAPWDRELMLPQLSYMAAHPVTKQWGPETTWGGKLTENAVQALCGDLLMEAQIRIERRGASRDIVMKLSVHDQAVAQAPRRHAQYAMELVREEMERGEIWSTGFPLKAEPKILERFGK